MSDGRRHGTIDTVITVLQYLVIAAAIGLVVFLVAVLVFGRGEQMAPLPARTSPAELPESGVRPENIRTLRFAVAVRGYRMSDVDWSLEKVAEEVEQLRAEVSRLGGDPDRLPQVHRDPVTTPVFDNGTGEPTDHPDQSHQIDHVDPVDQADQVDDPDGAPTTVLQK
ncbi:MAG: DivIVA domain-containing protein [Nakamurella sp.]